MSSSFLLHSLLICLNTWFTTFPSTQVCFCDLLQLLCSSLGVLVLSFLQPGLASHPKKKCLGVFFCLFVVASSDLVVGMQDSEYTDAQVGDAGGLFKSLDPALCGAVPAYPHPVLQFQPTSSSTAVPVYLIQYSSLSHPIFQFQSTSSSTPVSIYLTSSLHHPVLQF